MRVVTALPIRPCLVSVNRCSAWVFASTTRPSAATPITASGAASSTAWKLASERSRSLMPRPMDVKPIVAPAGSVSGDTVSDTLIRLPSGRTRVVR